FTGRGGPDDRYRYPERYGPRGYGYGDGDRPNLGTGGPMQHTGYSAGYLAQGGQQMGYQGQPGATHAGGTHHGHRGKGPANYQRSDERIRESVCEALTDHDAIDATDLEVTVKAGEVTITGTVEDRAQKRFTEDIVEQIPGVREIHN